MKTLITTMILIISVMSFNVNAASWKKYSSLQCIAATVVVVDAEGQFKFTRILFENFGQRGAEEYMAWMRKLSNKYSKAKLVQKANELNNSKTKTELWSIVGYCQSTYL